MPTNESLYNVVRDLTNGVVKEQQAPKVVEAKDIFDKMKAVMNEAKAAGLPEKDLRSVFEDVVNEFNVENPPTQKLSEMVIESLLTEEKDKKEEEWSDSRSHEEAVRQIVRDSWKELYADNAFKGGAEPTRDDVMKEVEFQSKHGLEHRPDASAIRYDAFKKVMKKVKNIQKKLDAESNETPEEEDETAKAGFDAPSTFVGMKENFTDENQAYAFLCKEMTGGINGNPPKRLKNGGYMDMDGNQLTGQEIIQWANDLKSGNV